MTSRSETKLLDDEKATLADLQPDIEHILDMLLNDDDTRKCLDDLADRHGLERVEVYRATNIVKDFRRQRSEA